jgi:hypothetical protein
MSTSDGAKRGTGGSFHVCKGEEYRRLTWSAMRGKRGRTDISSVELFSAQGQISIPPLVIGL